MLFCPNGSSPSFTVPNNTWARYTVPVVEKLNGVVRLRPSVGCFIAFGDSTVTASAADYAITPGEFIKLPPEATHFAVYGSSSGSIVIHIGENAE